jgi:hypothetical protein
MQEHRVLDLTGGLWLAPLAAGLLLILFGLLLFVFPQLLQLLVAGVFVLAGLSLVGAGWRMRRRVSFRPLHGPWEVRDES